MSTIRNLYGGIDIRVTCADPLMFIRKLLEQKITLYDIEKIDTLNFRILILAKDYRRVCTYLEQAPCEYKVIGKKGIYWILYALSRRVVLILGILVLIFATVWIPSRVFFIEVVGNNTLSEKYILEKAGSCGVSFGAIRKQVRSERIKNTLLEMIPELQWAGINTSGCVATIQVRERSINRKDSDAKAPSNIIAERDGIVYSCTVEEGFPLCQVGQAVKKGQILVSGYKDLGLLVAGCSAKGEVYALTHRSVTSVSPNEYRIRSGEISNKTKYSVLLGKNKINLYKDSGITDGTCVKIYEEEYVSLPGGFQLPIAIIKEHIIFSDVLHLQDTDPDSFTWVREQMEDYILHQMIAGEILFANAEGELLGPLFTQSGQYACVEMIGRNKIEEIVDNNGQS